MVSQLGQSWWLLIKVLTWVTFRGLKSVGMLPKTQNRIRRVFLHEKFQIEISLAIFCAENRIFFSQVKYKKPALSWPFLRSGRLKQIFPEVPPNLNHSCECEQEALLQSSFLERKGYPALSVKCCFVSFLKNSKQKHSWR